MKSEKLTPAMVAGMDGMMAVSGAKIDRTVARLRTIAAEHGTAQATADMMLALTLFTRDDLELILLAALRKLAFGVPADGLEEMLT